MRKKSKKPTTINGKVFLVDQDVADYIYKIEQQILILNSRNENLEAELKVIKPIIETKKLKPAVSDKCESCIHVCTSNWNGAILGCKKDCVCDDYYPVK